MMSSPAIYFFNRGYSSVDGAADLLAGEGDLANTWRGVLSGKGASLHAMAALGFRVPAGFTVPASWCDAYHRSGGTLPEEFRTALRRAVSRLERTARKTLGEEESSLRVAVRAGTADRASCPMATALNLRSLSDIESAVERGFLSWEGERRLETVPSERGEASGGLAVTVQEMCPAEVAGIALATDPESEGAPVVLEAVGGLGVELQSGRVTPDRYRLARPDLELEYCVTSRTDALLTRQEARRVADEALELVARSGSPLDVEWALAGGRVYLLDARPVRKPPSIGAVRRLLAREAERLQAFLAAEVDAGDSLEDEVAVRCDLGEAFSHPTPMTWDVLSEFFSGGGGYVGSCQDLGLRPSRRVLTDGFLVLVGGHVYAGLRRASELFDGTDSPFDGTDSPGPHRFAYSAGTMRRRPRPLAGPAVLPETWPPGALARRWPPVRSASGRRRRGRGFATAFLQGALPSYAGWCRAKKRQSLVKLRTAELVTELDQRIDRVFQSFGRDALTVSALAGRARIDLFEVLERRLGSEAVADTLDLLLSDVEGRVRLQEDRALARVAHGELSMEAFLASFGHVAAGALELARARPWEDVEAAWQTVRSLDLESIDRREIRARERKQAAENRRKEIERLLREEFGTQAAVEFGEELDRVRTLLEWRDEWKHYWMHGLDVVRRVLVELDRRLVLDGMVFYLTRPELREIVAAGGRRTGEHRALIRSRRDEERLARGLILPEVLTVGRLQDVGGTFRETERVRGQPSFDDAQDVPTGPGSSRPEWLTAEPARGTARVPPEPFVPPLDAGRVCRALLGCAAMIAGGMVLCAPGLRSLFLPPLALALDWTLEAFSPLGAVVLVAASATVLGSIPGVVFSDRRRHRLARERIRWYRRQLRRLTGTADAGPESGAGGGDRGRAALERRIKHRHRLALVQRGVEQLEPFGWSVLAICLTFLWVEDRFPGESAPVDGVSRIELPAAVESSRVPFGVVARLSEWTTGGGGITAEPVIMSPITIFLVTSILIAFVLRRVTGVW